MTRLSAQGLDIHVGERTLCRGLDLSLEPGQCWAILGANGSGKTTLLHTLAGLLPPANGEVRLGDREIGAMSRRTIAQLLGLLLQESHDPFPTTVLETALTGRHPHLGRWQREGAEEWALAREALTTMDLDGIEGRMVQTLSGGERRRLAIATLLTQAPRLLLLDEPLNHLDLHHQQALLQHLSHLANKGRTVAMVLHDPNQAVRYASHALLLYGDGSWESGESGTLLTAQRLGRLYRHPMKCLEQEGERLFLPE